MTIDKYTKFILTLIAVGILGLNFHLFNGDIIKKANANSHQIHKIAICDLDGDCAAVHGLYEYLKIGTMHVQ